MKQYENNTYIESMSLYVPFQEFSSDFYILYIPYLYDLKLYLHIPPLINMLIRHKFVLCYLRTNTPNEWSVLCLAAERGSICPPNARGSCKEHYKIQTVSVEIFLQNEGLPRTTGFCKLLHPFSPSSLTCVQNKVPAVSKCCVSCRSTNLLAE